MDKKDIKNTFLSKRKYETASYLLPADFNRIAPQMDNLIKEMDAFYERQKKRITINAAKHKIAAKK